MIDLHFVPTMNGQKVVLMLEEVGLPYRLLTYNSLEGEHLTPEFRKLNPNLKLPVMVDLDPADNGQPLVVFETGAILLYLAEKTGQFLPREFRRRELAGLIWQVANLGPMHGQANHFVRYAPEGQDYAVDRYMREARRTIAVLEYRLQEVDYLAEEYSIADMACWPFVRVAHAIDIDVTEYPRVSAWLTRIEARAAAAGILTSPTTATPPAILRKRMRLTETQWSNVFGDRLHAVSQDLAESSRAIDPPTI